MMASEGAAVLAAWGTAILYALAAARRGDDTTQLESSARHAISVARASVKSKRKRRRAHRVGPDGHCPGCDDALGVS